MDGRSMSWTFSGSPWTQARGFPATVQVGEEKKEET